jgi:hypothetical protein
MFDDVERRTLLVQPSREDALPASPGLLDVQLHEGSGKALILPRSGRVAGTQANHRVAETDRLSRLERDVANDPVALVEQPEDSNTLRHWRHTGDALDRLGRVHRHGICAIGGLAGIARRPIATRA